MSVRETSYPTSASGILHFKTLVLIRWVAIAGQISALLFARYGLDLGLDLTLPFCVIGASVIVNLISHGFLKKHKHLNDNQALWALGFDTLQLSLLLYLTGGLGNPFVMLMLAPLAVAAATLSGRSVIIMTLFGLAAISALCFGDAKPLWPQMLPPLFYGGAYAALMVSSLFLVLYMRRVARESRRLGDALSRSWMQLEREQKISAFGALAAALAHELGSPLGTIAVISRELSHALAKTPHEGDAALLESEVARCKKILEDLAQKHTMFDETGQRFKLSDYITRIAAPYARPEIQLVIEKDFSASAEPVWPWHPVLAHGIGNFLQNAFQFASRAVHVTLTTSPKGTTIIIRDDGKGFAKDVLSRLGLAYTSGRKDKEKEGHMGLGVFIAKTLLERSGADIRFSNATFSNATEASGAVIHIFWGSSPTL